MSRIDDVIERIRVEWEGTDLGLQPHLVGDTKTVSEYDERDLPDLIEALGDARTFVPAHVLLTRISGVRYQAFPEWNGLRVQLAADGTATIDPAQRHDLAERWARWYRANPRPPELP